MQLINPSKFFPAQISLLIIWIISLQKFFDLVKTSNFYDLLHLTKFGSRLRKERSGVSQSCYAKRRTWNLSRIPVRSLWGLGPVSRQSLTQILSCFAAESN